MILTTRHAPLPTALTAFQRRGTLRRLYVNRKAVEETEAALRQLGVSLEVEAVGGCLEGEIWGMVEIKEGNNDN